MYLRVDRLQIELPAPKEPDPNAAAAVQDLLGGRFGEMSTLMNYTYQSFNFRGHDQLKPYRDLIANIATEELGHIELVAATINLLLTGSTQSKDPVEAPLEPGKDVRSTYHFVSMAQTAFVGGSMGGFWHGEYVFNSGNLVLDLLHNFFLECGARLHKIRVYEMTRNPVAREMNRVPPGPGRRARHCVRQGPGDPDGREPHQTPPHPEHPQREVPRSPEVRGGGRAPDPVPVQPRGLPGHRPHLARPCTHRGRGPRGGGWAACRGTCASPALAPRGVRTGIGAGRDRGACEEARGSLNGGSARTTAPRVQNPGQARSE